MLPLVSARPAPAAPRRPPPVRHPLPDSRLVCPAGHGLMTWDPFFTRLCCSDCPTGLWLTPDQAATLRAIQAWRGPGCSAASLLAEVALLEQGYPPVGYPW